MKLIVSVSNTRGAVVEKVTWDSSYSQRWFWGIVVATHMRILLGACALGTHGNVSDNASPRLV